MSNFTFDFVSLVGHRGLRVEVCYQGQRLFQLYKDDFDGKLIIEIIDDKFILKDPVFLKFPLSDFQCALKEAERLIDECDGK